MANVGLCYAHPSSVDGWFHECLSTFLIHDASTGGHVVRGGAHISLISGPRIAAARNTLVRRVLSEPDIEWMWMLDADMVFEPDTLERLLESADPVERPIVGGLAFAGGRTGRITPTLFRMHRTDGGQIACTVVEQYPKGLVKVDATGAACLLVHRSVLETMESKVEGYHKWFAEPSTPEVGADIGEDVLFCMRARALGFPIHVDTRLVVGHSKPQIIDEESFKKYLRDRKRHGDAGVEKQFSKRVGLG